MKEFRDPDTGRRLTLRKVRKCPVCEHEPYVWTFKDDDGGLFHAEVWCPNCCIRVVDKAQRTTPRLAKHHALAWWNRAV